MNAPDFLDIPDHAYNQDYLDSISGGFDDSLIYSSEPVIIEPTTTGKTEIISDLNHHATTPPAKNSAVYRLDFYDILNRAESELSALATDAGIDWQALKLQINKAQSRYTKKIALDKKSAGKVLAIVDFKTSRAGQEYPFITFFTQKHGGESFVFNGYQWLKDNGLINAKKLSESELKALAAKRAERDQQQAKKAERAKQQQALSLEQTIKRFNGFQKLFDSLPLATNTANTYLQTKGFTNEHLTALINAGFELKRGQDKNGGFIAYALKKGGKVTGYQKIYDKPVNWLNGNKENIFLPEAKNGSFAMIGKPEKTTDKLYLAEGFATALTVYLATGKPCVIALDAGNLAHVSQSLNKAYKNIALCADNDQGEKGNTGIYKALTTAKNLNLEIAYPVLATGEKCDFNDLFLKSDLKEVKNQLKTNKLDYSDTKTYYRLLVEYCPLQNKTDLNKHLKSLCFVSANELLLTHSENIQAAALPIQAIIDSRKIEFNAQAQINWFLDKKLYEIKKANSLINLDNVSIHNLTGKTNQAIAQLIRQHKKGIWLDCRPMGAGKTELMKVIADYAKQTEKYKDFDKQITYIAHRVALIKDAANRLDLRFYDDIAAYAGERTRTLAVCANSIINHNVAERVNILFIDEIRQTLEHILNGTCESRLEVFNALVNAIKHADLVIAADADLNQFTLNWLKSISNKPLHLIATDTGKTGKTVIELPSNSDLFGKLRQDLLSGQNVWIATDSMSKARTLNEFLTLSDDSEIGHELKSLFDDSGLNLSLDDVLLVTSENKADIKQALFLANPNQESKKYRVIIHTPVISSGVSVTNGHFKSVYAVFCNVTAPNEMLQTIARVRTAKEIYCTFKTGHVKNRATNLKDLIDGEAIKRARFSNNEALELDYFDRLRLEQIVNKNKSLNDFKSYFFLLVNQKGYDVLPCQNERIENTELDANIKNISAIVKQKVINDVFNTVIIDQKEATKIEKLSAATQQQTNALKRFKVTQLTGKESKENNDNDISLDDIDFILFNKGASIIANFELLSANLDDLKEQDRENYHFREKLPSKASKHLLFKTVVDGINGLKDGLFSSEQAASICEFLKDNFKELASNGLGNYAKVSCYPVKQLTEFLNKCGYDVLKPEKDTNDIRWYAIAPNEQVKAYAEARAYQRKLKNDNSIELELI